MQSSSTCFDSEIPAGAAGKPAGAPCSTPIFLRRLCGPQTGRLYSRDHGIGKSTGPTPQHRWCSREYLIMYKDNDVLYAPIHQADRITRHIGPESGPPSSPLAALIGSDQKPCSSCRGGSGADLRAHAKRQTAEGYAFEPDKTGKKNRKPRFTLKPLTSCLPSSRSKPTWKPNVRWTGCSAAMIWQTEVVCAPPSKVTNGKQVAVLVPFTVLRSSNYETFRLRLSVSRSPLKCLPLPIEQSPG